MTSVEQNTIVYIKRDADEGTPCTTAKLWILIEYRTHKTTNYEVISAKDVCGRINTDLHTGKSIGVKKDSAVFQATIVTISDDKNFLDKELKGILDIQKEEELKAKKRKRVSTSSKMDTCTSPPPTTQYQRWTHNSHDANTQHNGTMNKQSVIISNPNVQNYPPMTFDQQTQTDFKINSEYTNAEMRLTKIMMTEETILSDVHNVSLENHEIKQQVADLRLEIAEVKTLLKDIAEKLTNQNDGVHSTSTDFNRSGSILNSTQTSTVVTRTPHVNPPRILNLSHQSNYTPHAYNSISIEPVIEASNDSNFSYSNHSRMSLSASNQSIYQADTNHSDSAHVSATKLDYSNNSKSAESFIEDEGDPNEEVVIGSHNTTVPRNILTKINWNSYSAATRNLLRAKFSREVLATHSLTGKPSPGM